MKRAIVVVIDSMGTGAMPDCREFNDTPECNTLKNVCEFNNGLNVPNMEKMGLGNIQDYKGIKKVENPTAQYGTMEEKSKGKDTTTGHWEMAGLVSSKPFATFPDGFPDELIEKFIKETNCGGILANKPASGTAVIAELNEEHHKTKFPIVYTSADSVFQIAVDTDLIALETLYKWCETARRILDEDNWNVSRVIARPYKIIDGKPARISKDRRDYSMVPSHTVLNDIKDAGAKVIGIGKIEDIFSKSGITHAIHTGSNKEGLELTLKAVKNELDLDKIAYKNINITNNAELIFTNLVDTDMLYGHRNDAAGYGKAIEEIDTYVDDIINNMKDDDLLIITADHGCDPTVEGTDHTREYVPILVFNKKQKGGNLGLIKGFDFIADTVKNWLKI
ncbi:MAG TPA: phosphopentomutase [Candidatus Stercorousia faecigallinarum]|nr:phosphopentomutase [Candidatus Stercorousia faecigallinarum]